jgi:hypothetical protein
MRGAVVRRARRAHRRMTAAHTAWRVPGRDIVAHGSPFHIAVIRGRWPAMLWAARRLPSTRVAYVSYTSSYHGSARQSFYGIVERLAPARELRWLLSIGVYDATSTRWFSPPDEEDNQLHELRRGAPRRHGRFHVLALQMSRKVHIDAHLVLWRLWRVGLDEFRLTCHRWDAHAMHRLVADARRVRPRARLVPENDVCVRRYLAVRYGFRESEM